ALDKPVSEVFHIINGQTREPVVDPVEQVLQSGALVGLANHTVLVAKDDREYQIADSAAPIRDAAGQTTGVVLVFRDVTEKYQMEEKFRQSQKMEAIGQLAGGIAHDFNNMLGGIRGAAELIKGSIDDDEKNNMFLNMIIDAVDQSSALAEKLLSFAGRKSAGNTPVDLHRVIEEAVAIMRNTLDKKIHIDFDPAASRFIINGDEAQLQNIFLNLGINAGHAMPDGGNLSIHSEVLTLTSEYCQAQTFDLKPGSYIKVVVCDTGHGIPAGDLPRVFEPFFTTKKQGQGTGLGLAAVFGTVQQHQGAIQVYSEEGQGTCFHVLFPLLEEDFPIRTKSDETIITGRGLILLVDDEHIIRDTGQRILRELGYRVLLAEHGQQALDIIQKNRPELDLVIMDMIMPVMGGKECFQAMREISPEIPVLLASGFTKDGDLNELVAAGLKGFVKKPYSVSELSRAIADILGRA
ncbi:MAG: response regulator, partial [Desulfosudaceae bacterium]